jgi:hypothetical protein
VAVVDEPADHHVQEGLPCHRIRLLSLADRDLFFRFFKQILGCRHLYFHSENGIKLQAYCAIIACMLLCLWTGRKPTKRTYEMVCYYFLGLANEAELLAHLDKLKRQDAAHRRV